MLQETFILL